ncbi:MGMT family protein [Plebeiibacterium marinum]|uniref:MGMT family protein n=1 Tax=Plebeiibacterium marinum TaxID=2992111 RepID=A0AAE3MG24_9BACT|nr:MGMT family protein [Plebeiobacterium marinum]MCW3806894.1 MGMT family protein [Plebeiobacterium marinum]
MDQDFFQQVYLVVKQIPYGRVTSYGAIARYLGAARSSRMVGWALNNCKMNIDYIPAHRVVNRNGLLTGKAAFPGNNTMAEMLLSEGVKVKDDRVVDFKDVFWDPELLNPELD